MRRRLEILSIYLSGLGQGLAVVTVASLANVFKSPEHHGLTSSQYGALFLPFTVGAIAMAGASGRLSARFGMKRVVMVGVGLLAAAMAVVASTHLLPVGAPSGLGVLLAAMGLLGGGVGACISAINTYPARFFPSAAEGALTGLHAVLGLGTALPPLLLPLFVRFSGWWGLPLFVAGALAALVVGIQGVLTDAPAESAAAARAGSAPFPRIFWAFAAVALLYGLIETLLGNWGTVYLHEERGLSVAGAGLTLSLFWAMVTAGRVATAVFSRWVPVRLVYLVLPAVMMLGLVGVSHLAGQGTAYLAFAVAGLGCSAFLPLSVSFGTQAMPELAASVSGGMMAAFMSGFGLGAFGVGPLREQVGLRLSTVYAGATGVGAAMAVLAVGWIWHAGSRRGRQPALESRPGMR